MDATDLKRTGNAARASRLTRGVVIGVGLLALIVTAIVLIADASPPADPLASLHRAIRDNRGILPNTPAAMKTVEATSETLEPYGLLLLPEGRSARITEHGAGKLYCAGASVDFRDMLTMMGKSGGGGYPSVAIVIVDARGLSLQPFPPITPTSRGPNDRQLDEIVLHVSSLNPNVAQFRIRGWTSSDPNDLYSHLARLRAVGDMPVKISPGGGVPVPGAPSRRPTSTRLGVSGVIL